MAPIDRPSAAKPAPPRSTTTPSFLRPLSDLLGPLTTIQKPPGLTHGDASKKVQDAERMLRGLGFTSGPASRMFTGKTERALKQFQQARGLPAHGGLDDRTFASLKATAARKQDHPKTQAPGEQSRSVHTSERRLRALGYDAGKVDGVYDRQTARAVQDFKRDQPALKDDHGSLGTRARRALQSEAAALNHAPERIRRKPSEHRRDLDARVQRAANVRHGDGTRGFGEGASGKSVQVVQEHLKAAGFDPQRQDGVFDERTKGALKAYQTKERIPATGRVDMTTWRHLQRATIEAKSGTSPMQQVGERSAAVKRTEKLLQEVSAKPGAVDGLYTDRTQHALDRFRSKHHLRGRGKGVGPNTLNALQREAKKLRGVTASQLARTMPGMSGSRARELVAPLNRAMREFGIDTGERKAAFLAQLGHESGSLVYFQEIWGPTPAQRGYEGRSDLGNTHPGDGYRYRGRGPIQVTGRANYRTYGRMLGLPLVKKPWLASRPGTGFRIAGAYWQSHGLNGLADRRAFHSITLAINGGTNGEEDRNTRYALAKRVLHV